MDTQWKNAKEVLKLACPPRRVMNELVMDYFLREGLTEVAKVWQDEAGVNVEDGDIDEVEIRNEIRRAVVGGDIEFALKKTEEIAPGMLASRVGVLFALRKQLLIQMITKGECAEAIEYARTNLANLVEEDASLRSELEQVLALLIFENIQESPLAHVIRPKVSRDVADLLISAILAHKTGLAEPRLTDLVRESFILQWNLESAKVPVFKVLRSSDELNCDHEKREVEPRTVEDQLGLLRC